MIATLRAELRKLFTVRSTYLLILLAFAFVVLVGFYAKGYRISGAELHNPHHVADSIIPIISSLPMLFGSIIAILLMTHEYRYNTVMYTLTSSNSRSRVLFAKFVATSIFAVAFTLVILIVSPLLMYLGIHLHGNTLAPQTIPYKDLLWRCVFYGWSFIITGLLLAVLIRNQIGAIVSLFILPTIEQALALLLKNNAVYLPFMSSGEVLMAPEKGSITYGHAALVFSAYLLVGWAVAWVLFLRRDAN